MQFHRRFSVLSSLALASLALGSHGTAHAANVLFVADGTADTAIVAALMADGHTVTMVLNDHTEDGRNPTLAMPLDEYDVIFWSGSGGAGWERTDPMVFTNITTFVTDGGRLMYTGYDATLGDMAVVTMLGFSSANDAVGVTPGAITGSNSLSTGVRDVVGTIPSDGWSDKDCLIGPGADVTVVVTAAGDASCAQWAIRRVGDGEIAYVSNGAYDDSDRSWSTETSAFNAAVRNFAHAADEAAREPGAPLIEFEGPYTVDEGGDVSITVSVTDEEGDPVTFSWDLDGDETYGERMGEATVTIAGSETDGPSVLRFAVQASDGSHTSSRTRRVAITNVAPRVTSSPPTITSVGADMRYPLEVVEPAGALDPLTFTLTRGPEGMAIGADGVLTWRPTETDVTRTLGAHHIIIDIDDGDDGQTTHEFDLEVSPNRVPSAPQALYPANMVAILDRSPRLVVGDSVDEDVEDVLTYFFEIDTVSTFDSADRRESGAIAQQPGFTAWEIDEPLEMGRQYYWRAWSSDGTANSAYTMTAFYVVPDPSMIPDAGAPDAGVEGRDAGTAPPASRGGCAVSPASHTGGAWALLGLAALALVLRRRR